MSHDRNFKIIVHKYPTDQYPSAKDALKVLSNELYLGDLGENIGGYITWRDFKDDVIAASELFPKFVFSACAWSQYLREGYGRDETEYYKVMEGRILEASDSVYDLPIDWREY